MSAIKHFTETEDARTVLLEDGRWYTVYYDVKASAGKGALMVPEGWVWTELPQPPAAKPRNIYVTQAERDACRLLVARIAEMEYPPADVEYAAGELDTMVKRMDVAP